MGEILKGDGSEKNCLRGRIEGVRARGRQRVKYMKTAKINWNWMDGLADWQMTQGQYYREIM